MARQSASACIGVLAGCCLLLVVEVTYALPESHSPFFPEEGYRPALETCGPDDRDPAASG